MVTGVSWRESLFLHVHCLPTLYGMHDRSIARTESTSTLSIATRKLLEFILLDQLHFVVFLFTDADCLRW